VWVGSITNTSGERREQIGRVSGRHRCRTIKNPKSTRKVSIGTTKKSMATMSWLCSSRKVRHVEEGRGEGRRIYLATVNSATL
jgi:hypothetical protein